LRAEVVDDIHFAIGGDSEKEPAGLAPLSESKLARLVKTCAREVVTARAQNRKISQQGFFLMFSLVIGNPSLRGIETHWGETETGTTAQSHLAAKGNVQPIGCEELSSASSEWSRQREWWQSSR
jgi:hypothetical protein